MTAAKSLSSLIVLPIFSYFPAGDYIYIPEAGRDAKKQKYEEEPRVRAEPLVELSSDDNANDDSQRHRNAHARNETDGLYEVSFFFVHGATYSGMWHGNLSFLPQHL